MEYGGKLIPGGLPGKAAVREITDCNILTSPFGLTLTPPEAAALAQTRSEALVSAGRVEFGGGTMRALITAFCDSPYMEKTDYADTLCTLTRIFYGFKSDALDEVDDAEAMALMRKAFTGRGDLDMVAGRMEGYARNVRYGRDPENGGEPQDREEDEADE
jgi:hypothetical protein